jgi:hypothetical protein
MKIREPLEVTLNFKGLTARNPRVVAQSARLAFMNWGGAGHFI